MKLSGTLRKETCIVAVGTLFCSAVMQLIFFLTSHWDLTVLYANFCTWILTTLNFFAMGFTVKCTIQIDDAKRAGKIVRLTQWIRFLVCGSVLIVAIFVFRSYFNLWALLIPLLFPQVILILRGILRKEKKSQNDFHMET